MPHSVEMIGNSTTISVVSANSNHNECLLKIMWISINWLHAFQLLISVTVTEISPFYTPTVFKPSLQVISSEFCNTD